MTPIGAALGPLFDGGTAAVAGAAVLISTALWIVAIERVRFVTALSGFALLPSRRKRQSHARARLSRALAGLASAPAGIRERPGEGDAATEAQAASRVFDSPASRLVLRFFEEGPPPTADLRDLRLRVSREICEREIRSGIPLIDRLGRLALAVGLLGNVAALAETLQHLGSTSPFDTAVWRDGPPAALLVTEMAIAAAFVAVLARAWLARRARFHLEELRLAGLSLERWIGQWTARKAGE